MDALGARVPLRSSDGVNYEVEGPVAWRSGVVKDWMRNNGFGFKKLPTLFVDVDSTVLNRLLEYCRYLTYCQIAARTGTPVPALYHGKSIEECEAHFVNVDWHELSHLDEAARYLKIERLTSLTTPRIHQVIADMSVEELCTKFVLPDINMAAEEVGARSHLTELYTPLEGLE